MVTTVVVDTVASTSRLLPLGKTTSTTIASLSGTETIAECAIKSSVVKVSILL
jgi:hypothetical protein